MPTNMIVLLKERRWAKEVKIVTSVGLDSRRQLKLKFGGFRVWILGPLNTYTDIYIYEGPTQPLLNFKIKSKKKRATSPLNSISTFKASFAFLMERLIP